MPKWWPTSWTTVIRTMSIDIRLGRAAHEDRLAVDRDPVGHPDPEPVVLAPS